MTERQEINWIGCLQDANALRVGANYINVATGDIVPTNEVNYIP